MRKRLFFTIILLLTFLAACGSPAESAVTETGASPIEIVDPYVWAVIIGTPAGARTGSTPTKPNGFIYMTIKNHSKSPDRLLRVEGDEADVILIHQTTVKDKVTSMHPIDFLDIPANGQVELKPGGYHIMLLGMKPDYSPGDKVSFNLVFANAGSIRLDIEIKSH